MTIDNPLTDAIESLKEDEGPKPRPKPNLEVLTPGNLGGLTIYHPEQLEWINILFYGEAGVGKTRLAGSASEVAECLPVLLIDVEAGSTSVAMYPGIDIVRVTTYEELVEIYNDLKTIEAKEGNLPYKTIILDSITEMQKLGMEAVLKRTVERAHERGDDKDPDQPDFGDWAKNANQTRRMIRAFRNLECHTIFTALAQVDSSRPTKPKAKPYLNGKMADEVAAFLDIVLYMYKKADDTTETVHRVLLSSGTDEIIAKDRSDKLPSLIIDPTYKDIHNFIKGNLEND